MLPLHVAESIAALAIIAVLVLLARRTPPTQLTPLAGLSLAFPSQRSCSARTGSSATA